MVWNSRTPSPLPPRFGLRITGLPGEMRGRRRQRAGPRRRRARCRGVRMPAASSAAYCRALLISRSRARGAVDDAPAVPRRARPAPKRSARRHSDGRACARTRSSGCRRRPRAAAATGRRRRGRETSRATAGFSASSALASGSSQASFSWITWICIEMLRAGCSQARLYRPDAAPNRTRANHAR